MPRRLPITLIAQDSSRLRAYLHAFTQSDTLPSRVVTLKSRGVAQDVLKEAEKYEYAEFFFDLSTTPEGFYAQHELPVHATSSSNINDREVYKALLGDDNQYAVFTGGGIVSRNILDVGMDMIHIHPGKLPEYRGSTCFYYSLLQESTLNASAIILREQIDTGPIVGESNYSVNIQITNDMPNFMDHVLDPFIRAKLLEMTLKHFSENGSLERRPQPEYDGQNYYIMHPVLRAAAVERVNALYDASSPKGIFQNASTT